MTALNIAELKAAAEKATAGPWSVAMTGRGLHVITVKDNVYVDTICQWAGDHPERTDNLKFIAASNPQAILSLIARLEKAEAALTPFADADIPPDAPDGGKHYVAPNTFYEYRAAREALKTTEASDG